MRQRHSLSASRSTSLRVGRVRLASPCPCHRLRQPAWSAPSDFASTLVGDISDKLKQFRRVATRYDKLLATFMGFVKLAAIA